MRLYGGKKRNKGEKREKRKFIDKIGGTMNLILIILGIVLVSFTVTMIYLFMRYGMTPDTLITCVFAALASEAGIMGWIRTVKEKERDREWEKEQKEENEKKSEEDHPRNDL